MSRDNMTSVDTWEIISDENGTGGGDSIAQVYQMDFLLHMIMELMQNYI